MTLEEYQRSARRTINSALSADERLVDAAAGLAEEAGEVLGLVRKRVFQRRQVPRPALVEELGDALWCLAITADSVGISLDEIAAANDAKLRSRHPGGFTSTA